MWQSWEENLWYHSKIANYKISEYQALSLSMLCEYAE